MCTGESCCLHVGSVFWLTLDDLHSSDTDECTSGVAECGQVCVNTEGSFHCSCYSGYKLTEDGINCTGVESYNINRALYWLLIEYIQ